MILTYMNKNNCLISDPDAVEYKGQKKEARSTNTRCIAGFYDLNGAKGPNKFGKDIVPFGVIGLGSSWNTLWSSSEYTADLAYFRGFYSTYTIRTNHPTRSGSYIRAICVKKLVALEYIVNLCNEFSLM
ncbi:hypothetical protein J6G99_08275 [bacterium]|nr:hypothetical protein [bacterium]